MTSDLLEKLAILRIVVGYLGEKNQFGWWSSAFFSKGSDAFLSPVFGRTQLLAQCTGVSQAATLVHDDRIGIGDVYHLFRLPEELAQGIHEALHNPELPGMIESLIDNQSSALEYVKQDAEIPSDDEVGPVRMGNRNDLHSMDHWDGARTYYAKAFATGEQVFPFFSGGGR